MYHWKDLHHSTQCRSGRLRHKVPEREVKVLLARSYTCLDAFCLSQLCAHFSFELHKPLRWQGQHVRCLHVIDEDLKACSGQDHKMETRLHIHILKWTKCLHHICPKASLATGKMSDPILLQREWMLVLNPSSSPSTAQRPFGIYNRNLWLQKTLYRQVSCQLQDKAHFTQFFLATDTAWGGPTRCWWVPRTGCHLDGSGGSLQQWSLLNVLLSGCVWRNHIPPSVRGKAFMLWTGLSELWRRAVLWLFWIYFTQFSRRGLGLPARFT